MGHAYAICKFGSLSYATLLTLAISLLSRLTTLLFLMQRWSWAMAMVMVQACTIIQAIQYFAALRSAHTKQPTINRMRWLVMARSPWRQSLSLAFSIVVVAALKRIAGLTSVVPVGVAAFFLSLFLGLPLFLQSFGW